MTTAKRLFLSSCLSLLISCLAPSTFAQEPSQETFGDFYASIKKAIRETIKNEDGFTQINLFGERDVYHVQRCTSSSDDLGVPANSKLVTPSTIALDVIVYQNDFTKLGIPESIWSGELAALDGIGMSAVAGLYFGHPSEVEREKVISRVEAKYQAAQEHLIEQLNAYRKTKARLPTFMYSGDCGGGEEDIEITTTPRGATVRYIPVFNYRLCELRGINPEDIKKCSGWLTALSVYVSVIGKYHYLATWPDGTQRTGIFNITKKTSINISQ